MASAPRVAQPGRGPRKGRGCGRGVRVCWFMAFAVFGCVLRENRETVASSESWSEWFQERGPAVRTVTGTKHRPTPQGGTEREQ